MSAAPDPRGLHGHIVVCGLHGLGLRIVEQLRAAGQDVVVVDDDPDRRGARAIEELGVPLLVADATAPGTLDRAGLDGAAAVVAVETEDLRSLQVALLVRDRRADVRLVTRLGNAAVGRAVADDDGPGAVLDVAALAAPSVVEACLQDPVHELDVAGHRFLAVSADVTRAGSLRGLYGDLAPLAVSRSAAGNGSTVGNGGAAGNGSAAGNGTALGNGSALGHAVGNRSAVGTGSVAGTGIVAENGSTAGNGSAVAVATETQLADGETVVCPGRDHDVRPGDRVSLLGRPHELTDAGITTAAPEPGERRTTRRGAGRDLRTARPETTWPRAQRLRRAGAALRQVARESDRGLRWALVALVALIALSTLVIRVGYQRPPEITVVDALYFTVESVATVGFGDYSFADQALWLRLWAIFLMLSGVATTAIPLAFLTDMLISRRLAATSGRRRAAGARGHVVVVGLGAVGVSVLESLRARGRAAVVVERDPANRFLDRARAMGVPVVLGDATSAEVLEAARVPHAAAIAVLTSDDMDNIETGLAVRDVLGDRWEETPVVLRLFDRELARTVARRFDFRFVRSTADLAAPWFVGAALGLDVLDTFPVHRHAFLLGRLTVPAGGNLDGVAMRELSARTRVVALRRAGRGEPEHPRRDTRFAAGDEAYLVGPYEELLDVLRHQGDAPVPELG